MADSGSTSVPRARRVAMGGIAVECCTFSPVSTKLADFAVLRGAALRARYPFLDELSHIEWIPLMHAKAVPGGSVERASYDELKQELVRGIASAGKLDGVYLELHGAMHVLGMDDAEGDLVSAVREVVGPSVVISASFDLHGNVTKRLLNALDLFTGYRTAPHIDVEETRRRACLLLADQLRTGVRQTIACARLPLLLPGEYATTTSSPGRELYAELERAGGSGVSDASIMIGYAWADEPRSAANIIAMAPDPQRARSEAIRIAKAVWDARRKLRPSPVMMSIEACLTDAVRLSRERRPVFISDSGDNITAGAPGDSAISLEAILAERPDAPRILVAPIVDAPATAAAEAAGTGMPVTLTLGGALGQFADHRVTITGRALRIEHVGADTHVHFRGEAGTSAANIDVIISALRTPFTEAPQYDALGVSLAEYDIVVVKLGYLFPDLQEAAEASLLALTPGAVPLDITLLDYTRISRPSFPLDPEMEFVSDAWIADDSAG